MNDWLVLPHGWSAAPLGAAPVARAPLIAGRLPIGDLSRLPGSNLDGQPGYRTVYLPGAFDDTVAQALRGEGPGIKLRVNHDPARDLASTADGTLQLWLSEDGLTWQARVHSPIPVAWCSMTAGPTEFRHQTLSTGETVKVVTRALLTEISLVERPAFHAPAWVVPEEPFR
ncbi:HK97 family phage prohead protease [Gemmata sp. G18]|uniref:HK97 family phage prohead protease n=1 Tax=Gemmata palustris TaxID=2822762 RepID=A0ABS5BRK0_9BACT|nr:HK97 family phage prohead protease [Gemmata palustris]MBP3955498.1 HK97 family phage prohead protease [Gemmata palustris]